MDGNTRTPSIGRQDETEQTIQRNEAALLRYTRASHPNEWAATHRNLAIAYSTRLQGSLAENTEQVIVHYELALGVITEKNARQCWATMQANLGRAYGLRVYGIRAENLECALEHYRLALQASPRDSHPAEWGRIHNDLGTVYHHRICGDRADNIECAIKHYYQALNERTRGKAPSAWATTQANLASAYCIRIRGDRADNIERAIERYSLALEVRTSQDEPIAWAQTQNNLANAYQLRLLGDRGQNIEQAIASYLLALSLDLRSAAPVDWAMAHANLAAAFRDREQGGAAENLELALSHLHDALQVRTLEDMPNEWAMTHNELGITYRRRVTGDRRSNLESAVAHYEQALKVHIAEGFPWDWAMLQNNLGLAHLHLAHLDGARHDDLAVAHFRSALTVFQPSLYPAQCRWVARHLGDLHARHGLWQEAVCAYELSLKASEQLFQAGLLRQSREAELLETGDLHRRAAYAMAKAGRLEEAVMTLENGRARSLSIALALDKAIIQVVRHDHPELLAQYETLISELHAQEARELQNRGAHLQYRDIVQTIGDIYERLHALTQQLSDTDDRGWLLHSASFADVIRAINSTPIVYVASTDLGGLALIVQPDATITALWLDALTEQEVDAKLSDGLPAANGYADVYREWRARPGNREARDHWLATLAAVCNWLETVLIDPLCRALLSKGVATATIVPTGALSLLPIHAVSQEIAFAYAPNARVLSRDGFPDGDLSALVVDNPNPEGALALPLGEIEVGPLFRVHGRHVVRLSGREASKACIALEAKHHDIWHLITHGEMNWHNPLESSLVLAGGEKLFLCDILQLRLDVGLAVLSACETGFPDHRLLDEVTSLSTGMLQAGACCVIGSLWAVEDLSTALLLRRFYELLLGEGEDKHAQSAGVALRKAQAWLSGLSARDVREMLLGMTADPSVGMQAKELLLGWLLRIAGKDEPPFAHPYYWAGFYATGNAFAYRVTK